MVGDCDLRATNPSRLCRRHQPPKPPCAVTECGRKVEARGFCNRHYLRWKQYGDPLASAPPRPPRPPRPREQLRRGETGTGRWWLLVWFCSEERILSHEDLAAALRSIRES